MNNHNFNHQDDNNDETANGFNWRSWFKSPNTPDRNTAGQDSIPTEKSRTAPPPPQRTPPPKQSPSQEDLKIKMNQMVNAFNSHCIKENQEHLMMHRHSYPIIQSPIARHSGDPFGRGPNNDNVGHMITEQLMVNWERKHVPSHNDTLPPYSDSSTSTNPTMNHGEGCKCPLHNVIERKSVPEQQGTDQQQQPQASAQSRKTIKLTPKQQIFLNEQVFKQQWVRLQVKTKGEQSRYARHKLSQWQKNQINGIHTIEKKLLELFQISLTNYIVLHATDKTEPKPNTTGQPPQEPGLTERKREPGMTHQGMPEPNVTQPRMPETNVTQQRMPGSQGTQQSMQESQREQQRMPESQLTQQATGSNIYNKQPGMPMKLGGLLNVRPASFLQNHNGFANVPNSPVLENMNRIHKMYDQIPPWTGIPGLNGGRRDNYDSGGSGSSSISFSNRSSSISISSPSSSISTNSRSNSSSSLCSSNGSYINYIGSDCVGVQGTAAYPIYGQSSGAYAMNVQNTGPCAMDMENVGAWEMDAQNTGPSSMNMHQNVTRLSQRRRRIRHVVLDQQQQENYNSYRARKNWRKTPGTEPYLVNRSNSPSSSYNVQAQQQYQNGFSSQSAQGPTMSRADRPYTPFVANGRSKYLARSVSASVTVDPNFKRPLNPPYVYPENIKPRTPPPPYPTDMVYHQQFTQPAQPYTEPVQQYMQPDQQYTQPDRQYPPPCQPYTQPIQQYSQTGQPCPQPSRQYPQPGQQYVQPDDRQYPPSCQPYTQPYQQNTQSAQQCPQPSQQYPQTRQQYPEPCQPYPQTGHQRPQSTHPIPQPVQQYPENAQQYTMCFQQQYESTQQVPQQAPPYASQPAPQRKGESATPILYYI